VGQPAPAARSDAEVITVLASGHASRARRASAEHRSAGVVTTLDVATPRPPAPCEHAAADTSAVPSRKVSLKDVVADLRRSMDVLSGGGASGLSSTATKQNSGRAHPQPSA